MSRWWFFISPIQWHAIWPDIMALSCRVHGVTRTNGKFYVAAANFAPLHIHGSFKVSFVGELHKSHTRCATTTIMFH